MTPALQFTAGGDRMLRGRDTMRRMMLLPLLILASLAVPVSANAAPLEPCRLRGVEHDAMCGKVRRPLNPDRPQGTAIDVHFAVLPALARNKHPDPVFFLAGGPGQSAIALGGMLDRQFSRLLNRRDLILVDQRGTGRSAPLTCESPPPTAPLRNLLDPQVQKAQLAECLERLKALPYGDLRQFTTTIAMADLDAVREALGAQRINVIGGSYGTRAALEYLRAYPQRVRRVVIDGVAPPDMVLPASFSTDTQSAFDTLLLACEQEPRCHARYPNLKAQWSQMLAALPRDVSVRHPVTGESERFQMTRDMALAMLRLPLYVPRLASALPLAVTEASQGRFDALFGVASAMVGPRHATDMAQGMHFSVICAEDYPRIDASQDLPGRDFGPAFSQVYRAACADWPRGAVPEAFYQVPASAAAVLVLSGGLDPVTPPRHGERVAAALGPLARHVVVPNAGHGVMGIGCMRDVLFKFVDMAESTEALGVDTRCAEAIPRPLAFTPVQGAGK